MDRGVERRMNGRDRIVSEAWIWRSQYSIIPCLVRDFSPGGAGLAIPDAILPLPPEFDLTFDHVTHRCTAVWRHLGRMGLKFVY
jgi:hypothetical protein